MNDIGWGLWMTLAGMGTVFALLAVLMALLLLIGRLDRPRPAALVAAEDRPALTTELTDEPPLVAAPSVEILHDGLTRDQIAAVALAVLTHTRVRRAQAAPAMRSHQPGSHLYASRWVAAGRAQQTQTWRRS